MTVDQRTALIDSVVMQLEDLARATDRPPREILEEMGDYLKNRKWSQFLDERKRNAALLGYKPRNDEEAIELSTRLVHEVRRERSGK